MSVTSRIGLRASKEKDAGHVRSGPNSDDARRRGASLDVLALQRAVGNAAVHRLLPLPGLPGEAEQVAAATPTGQGRPLDEQTRAFMEARFGTSLQDVRVHSDAEGEGLAEALNAEAYAVGPHVVFGRDRYAPRQFAGRHLLAHELAHVIQQRGGSVPSRVVSAAGASERAADSAARQVLAGSGSVQVSRASGPAVAMKDKEKKLDWYGTAFTANRAFATHFRSKVPPGWPYSETLKKLWEATKAHWSHDESRNQIKVVDDEKAIAAAKPFIDAVKAFQVGTLKMKGAAANGVLDPKTSKALAASLQTKKEPKKEPKKEGAQKETLESQTAFMEFELGRDPSGQIELTGRDVADTPDWVEHRLKALQWDVVTGGFNVFCEGVKGPMWIPAGYIHYGLTNARPINQYVYADRDAALAAVKAEAQSGQEGTPFAYYRVLGVNIILPTVFSPSSSPFMIERFKAHLAEVSKDVKDVMTVQAAALAFGIGGRLAGNYALKKSLQVRTGPSLAPPPPSPGRTPPPSEPAASALRPPKGQTAPPDEPPLVMPKPAAAPEPVQQRPPAPDKPGGATPIERGRQYRAQREARQKADAQGGTRSAERQQPAPPKTPSPRDAAPANPPQSDEPTPIQRGRQYREQREATQKAEAAEEHQPERLRRTGTDDPVGVAKGPRDRNVAGGTGGEKPPVVTKLSPGPKPPPEPMAVKETPLPEGTHKSSRTLKPRTASRTDPEMLRANMEAAGKSVPPGHDAHHMVLKKGGGWWGAQARRALQRVGIKINDPANGIALPGSSTERGTVFEPEGGPYHGTMHTPAYYKAVTERLRGVKSESEARAILRQIEDEIRFGSFPH